MGSADFASSSTHRSSLTKRAPFGRPVDWKFWRIRPQLPVVSFFWPSRLSSLSKQAFTCSISTSNGTPARGRSRARPPSQLDVPRPARDGYHIADVPDVGHEHQEALKAHAKAGMWNSTEATQISVPGVAGGVHPLRGEASQASRRFVTATDITRHYYYTPPLHYTTLLHYYTTLRTTVLYTPLHSIPSTTLYHTTRHCTTLALTPTLTQTLALSLTSTRTALHSNTLSCILACNVSKSSSLTLPPISSPMPGTRRSTACERQRFSRSCTV